jgi:hypothetical protein
VFQPPALQVRLKLALHPGGQAAALRGERRDERSSTTL